VKGQGLSSMSAAAAPCGPAQAPVRAVRRFEWSGRRVAPTALRCSVGRAGAELATRSFGALRSNSCAESDVEACLSCGRHAARPPCASRRSTGAPHRPHRGLGLHPWGIKPLQNIPHPLNTPRPFTLSLSKRGTRLRQAQPERLLSIDRHPPQPPLFWMLPQRFHASWPGAWGAGDFWGGEERRTGGGRACRRTGTLQHLTCRSCLSAVNEVNAASSAAPPPGRAPQRSRRNAPTAPP